MNLVERAIGIALSVHTGQRDKGGRPYILHPLRVMTRMDKLEEMAVAVLHDVVEDGQDKGWTLERLKQEGFGSRVVAAVDRLTRREGEDYFTFTRRAGGSSLSRKVKTADLADNMDIARIPNPKKQDLERVRRYRKAMRILREMDE